MRTLEQCGSCFLHSFPFSNARYLLNKGTKGKTDLIKLDNWGNDFERGDVDEYSIEAMDVGKVLMIQLHNDGGGWWHKNPDWFVNRISVLSSSQEDPFVFPCYRWVLRDLSVFEGKGNQFQNVS